MVSIVCAAALILFALTGLPAEATPAQGEPVTVGSKRFTESYILGEIIRQTLEAAGHPAVHRQGLGNTAIVEQALAAGRIDLYPEYTGTILREILKRGPAQADLAQLNLWLGERGLKAAVPLGFNNTYALAMRADLARELGLRSLGDLARLAPERQRELRTAFTQEFSQRPDGWPAVREGYGLALKPSRGLDHGLAYAALERGEVDIVDAYSTDAAIARLGLVLLQDDRAVFPRYDAVLLMRADFNASALQSLQALAGRLDESRMAQLNGLAESGRPFDEVARLARGQLGLLPPAADPVEDRGWQRLARRLLAPDLARLLLDHIVLVAASSGLALMVGLPLGILAHRRPRAATWILASTGLLQTIPSLALLAVLIAALGQIGSLPALIALFLYALLPIVGATHAALGEVSEGQRQAAMALGLRPLQVLRWVELPLARPVILSGLGSATVIGVGTATLAAFVGAGGLGERIVAGLAVNDTALMLAGALPAAGLAVAVQALFARWARPRGGPRTPAPQGRRRPPGP